MSVIVEKLLDRGGLVILNLVIRFKFVYTRENFCLKCECWPVKKYQHCRLIWKLCIVCEAVLKKAIAETLTEMVLLFMITLIWKGNYGSKVLSRDYHIYIYIYYIYTIYILYTYTIYIHYIYIYIICLSRVLWHAPVTQLLWRLNFKVVWVGGNNSWWQQSLILWILWWGTWLNTGTYLRPNNKARFYVVLN